MEGFITALVLGIGIASFITWARGKGIKASWYEWAIGVIGFAMLSFGVWHYIGSVVENEPFAGILGLLIFGVFGAVLLVLSGTFIIRRQRKIA